jgi:hypothetical protein
MMVAEERPDTGTDVARRAPFQPAATGPHQAEIIKPACLASLRQTLQAARAALDKTAAAVNNDVPIRPEQLRTVERHLDAVGRLLQSAHRELATVAEEIVRARLPEGACGVPWAVCPHCPGVGLASSAGSSWCPSCGRLGPRAQPARPTCASTGQP